MAGAATGTGPSSLAVSNVWSTAEPVSSKGVALKGRTLSALGTALSGTPVLRHTALLVSGRTTATSLVARAAGADGQVAVLRDGPGSRAGSPDPGLTGSFLAPSRAGATTSSPAVDVARLEACGSRTRPARVAFIGATLAGPATAITTVAPRGLFAVGGHTSAGLRTTATSRLD